MPDYTYKGTNRKSTRNNIYYAEDRIGDIAQMVIASR